MAKCILVVLDGLNYEVAAQNLGFLQALCEQKKGRLYKMTCELPSISRPLYECILTGITPAISGIVNNDLSFSKEISIFDLCKRAGLLAGAAAYHWVFELYNKRPFHPALHRHINDAHLALPLGHFYFEDDYLDTHLFADGENLRLTHAPDFLLFHSMNIDDSGHKFGSASNEYANKAKKVDDILSRLVPGWLDEGVQVIITADHGMSAAKTHGGLSKSEREVPFFVFGEAFSMKDCKIKQTQICGVLAEILGIKAHKKELCKELLNAKFLKNLNAKGSKTAPRSNLKAKPAKSTPSKDKK